MERAGQTVRWRFQMGGMNLPRFRARTTRVMPAEVQRMRATMEDSTPNLPPVRMSGPLTVDWMSPGAASLPETMPENTADWV